MNVSMPSGWNTAFMARHQSSSFGSAFTGKILTQWYPSHSSSRALYYLPFSGNWPMSKNTPTDNIASRFGVVRASLFLREESDLCRRSTRIATDETWEVQVE